MRALLATLALSTWFFVAGDPPVIGPSDAYPQQQDCRQRGTC
jgi:hypothetical protein